MTRYFLIVLAGICVLSGCAGLSTKASGPERQVSGKRGEIPRITPEELKSRLNKGETITIVDVRSFKACKEQHITGAISIPLKHVASRLDEFQPDQEIVFYCT